MNKILIIGTSCTGKTTLGASLAKHLQQSHFDLDDYHWLPNWIERDDDEFKTLIQQKVLPLDNWVVSGNYISLMKDILWPVADTIIWLDYSLPIILNRYSIRTYRRIAHQEVCCNGNYENIRHSFFSDENLLHWILMTYRKTKKRFRRFHKTEYKGKNWIILKQPKDEHILFR